MSMYRFVKDSSPSGTPKRLFVQGTVPGSPSSSQMGPPIVTSFSDTENLTAVYTRKKLSTELLGSSFESVKTSRNGDDGKRRITTKIVRKVMTLTRGEEQSQAEDMMRRADLKSIEGGQEMTETRSHMSAKRVKISDIVVGQEPNVSAKDYLLRWAKRTTHRYPGVSVTDFTKSWRDGLAFSSIIHRNRPDLIDFGKARQQRPRERMETAFFIAEREYGVTRLLDPEDVDTPNPDEKSLITYISSLHEVFPEPPPIHPLYDSAAQQRVQEYREIASSLHMWIREKYSLMQDHSFPPTLIEMKKLAAESSKFRTDEIPPRQRDKNYCAQLFKELEKYFRSVGEVEVEPELHIDNIERSWQRLMEAYQIRDRRIAEEIKRLEKLQRLAEKVHRYVNFLTLETCLSMQSLEIRSQEKEIKQTDSNLDTIERAIENESRRIERIHPLEAKKIADQIDQDLATIEQNIQSLKTDVNTLRNGRYPQASDLDKRVNKLHERWVNMRHLLHNKIVGPLANLSFPVEERTVTKHIRTVQETRNVDTNPHFRTLQEHIEWCKNKMKQLKKADYGNDLASVSTERDIHQREHKQIDQFHSKVEACVTARQYFQGEELVLYNQLLGQLQKIYAELLSFSTSRMTDLETLLDFIQSATNELSWLNEKEEIEVTRDWSDTKLDVRGVEKYFENLMSDLEKREIQFNSVLERGECLVLQNHPATKAIEAHMAAMNAQWAWLLQLTHCLETHLLNTRNYQAFFKDVQATEEWLKEKDEIMNTEFSQGDFSLDVGEKLLQGMQNLRDELNNFGDQVQALTARAQDIVPLKQRRQPVTRPMTVTAICNYKQNTFVIEKNKECTLTDNSGRTKWRVHNSKGIECQVPGVCFVLPPPDKDALDAADRLRRQYDRSLSLWQKKQLRMRQNMIFATIKVVKGWDLPQFIAIGAEQRNAIRKALNEDADKLMAEGDPSDPQLRRLRREMDEVNRLFDEFEKRARAEEESKNQARIFNTQISNLQLALDEAERIINQRVLSPLPRDIDTLQHLVLEHKEFESRLQNLEPEIEQVKDTFRSITLKTPQHKKDLEKVLDKWKYIWNTSNIYIERLKCIEIVLNGMDDATQVISEFEKKLALFDELPNTKKGLEDVHDDLLKLESAVGQQQIAMDQLNDDFDNTRRLTEKSRPNQRGPHADVDRLDKEIQKLNNRWSNVCAQLADRLRGCKQAYDLLKNYGEAKVNLLNSVVERAPKIEQVNVNGGRFIREGKRLVEQMQPQPFRTFRTEFHMSSASEHTSTYTTTTHYSKQYIQTSKTENGNGTSPKSPDDQRSIRRIDESDNITNGRPPDKHTTFTHIIQEPEPWVTTMHFNEIKSLKRIHRVHEGISTDINDINDIEGILNPYTGERLTIKEAIAERILDVRTGKVVISTDGTQVSINEAQNLGKVDSTIAERLQGPCGIAENGRDLTLLEAIQREIYEAEHGFLDPSEKRIKGLVDERTGWVVDRNSGNKYQIDAAVKCNVVESDVREIVDPKTDNKITILQALDNNLINPKLGKYILGHEKISFLEAKRRQLIVKPKSLKEIIDDNLMDADGLIFSPTHHTKLTLLEAANRGVLDLDSLKTILDLRTNEYVTLSEALKEGIILHDSRFRNSVTNEVLPIQEAVSRGYIISVVKKSIFDVDGFQPPDKTDHISFNAANTKGYISKKSNGSLLVNKKNGKLLPFSDAVQSGEVKPEVYENLIRPIGIVENQQELTLLEAVFRGYIEPKTGNLLEPSTGKVVFLNDAIAQHFITPEGAALFNSLLNLNVSTRVTRTLVQRYVTVTSQDVTQEIITYTEALRLGLINNEQQTYTDPQTHEVIPIVQAISEGKLAPDSENSEKIVTGQVIKTPTVSTPTKTFNDKCVTTDFITNEKKSFEKHIYALPSEGLSLSQAINQNLYDPTHGLFLIQVSKNKLPVSKALEKKIIDSTGHYISPEGKINMQEAIEKGLITFEEVMDSDQPDKTVTTIKVVRIEPNVIYDPSSHDVTFLDNNQSSDIATALTENKIPLEKITIKDPNTNKIIPVSQAVEQNIVDLKQGTVIDNSGNKITLKQAAQLGLLAVVGAPVVATKATIKIVKHLFVTDPKTGEQIPAEVALEKGIIDQPTLEKLEEQTNATQQVVSDYLPTQGIAQIEPSKIKTLSTATISLYEQDGPSEADKTRARITIEPSYKVKIGRAQSLSPEREAKKVVLQKLRKKIVKPKDAVSAGIIDPETAQILDQKSVFVSSSGEPLTLQEALEAQKLDGEQGKIVDPQRGDLLTIYEAIDRGILDPDGTNELLVPLNRSLSIPELVKQGLLDPSSHKIVHPETGAHLSISEAIVCDIVDPLSTLVEKSGDKVTLGKALEIGVVDDEKSTVETNSGTKDLQEAVKEKIFDVEIPAGPVELPPAGMTFPVAVKRGLVDTDKKEIIHPLTNESIPLAEAIEDNFIMTLPFPTSPDSVKIENALESNLIDSKNSTFKDPKTGDIYPISEAVEKGY
ncbi:unnamed protein product [Diabrotica balteata]|uniref:Calponin-homology (CH) domain-containing protein n=1 Tax=Diabrotica balteata TaxID=107213 RepID=A0A9N9T0D6_DIABA|nr:unnamed protein product [Diabrotica balteata]